MNWENWENEKTFVQLFCLCKNNQKSTEITFYLRTFELAPPIIMTSLEWVWLPLCQFVNMLSCFITYACQWLGLRLWILSMDGLYISSQWHWQGFCGFIVRCPKVWTTAETLWGLSPVGQRSGVLCGSLRVYTPERLQLWYFSALDDELRGVSLALTQSEVLMHEEIVRHSTVCDIGEFEALWNHLDKNKRKLLSSKTDTKPKGKKTLSDRMSWLGMNGFGANKTNKKNLYFTDFSISIRYIVWHNLTRTLWCGLMVVHSLFYFKEPHLILHHVFLAVSDCGR